MKKFTGKNKDFTVYFNPERQSYTVYKKNRLIIVRYSYDEVKSYLN